MKEAKVEAGLQEEMTFFGVTCICSFGGSCCDAPFIGSFSWYSSVSGSIISK